MYSKIEQSTYEWYAWGGVTQFFTVILGGSFNFNLYFAGGRSIFTESPFHFTDPLPLIIFDQSLTLLC